MHDLKDDPEYEIRWPNDVLAKELDKLIALGETEGTSSSWSDEVITLLRQAFTSAVPEREFLAQFERTNSMDEMYGDEEPF